MKSLKMVLLYGDNTDRETYRERTSVFYPDPLEDREKIHAELDRHLDLFEKGLGFDDTTIIFTE